MTGPTSLADLLRRSEHLKQLRAEADQRRQLTERVRAGLPAAEAAHLVSAHINALDELVVVLDSPAWAARARYAQESLRGSVRPLCITRVRIRSRPQR